MVMGKGERMVMGRGEGGGDGNGERGGLRSGVKGNRRFASPFIAVTLTFTASLGQCCIDSAST